MKSYTRTVLNATLTGASSYSSGPLDVGDLYELAIDCDATSVTYTSGRLQLNLSRIGADGNLYLVGAAIADFSSGGAGKRSSDFGNGFAPIGGLPHSFGDQIQIDLVADPGNSVTTAISILGKG